MMTKIIGSKSDFEKYVEEVYPTEPVDVVSNELIEDFDRYSYPLLAVWVGYDRIRLFTQEEFKIMREFMELSCLGSL